MFIFSKPTAAFCILLVIVISTLGACGSGDGPGDPGGSITPPADVNVVSSLISVNPSSDMAAIIANESGAMVFFQETDTNAVVINRVVVITNLVNPQLW